MNAGFGMKQLMIRNRGLAPVESFTILGLSTARGSDKIGQFGSGTKHGILTLLRHEIGLRIFIGEKELAFTTHPARISGKDYLEVRYTFEGQEHKTGMCLDFGSLDWDTPGMAVREFICNALDQGENIKESAAITNEIQPDAIETRVFIELDEPIANYWANIRDSFLQYDSLEGQSVIPARSCNPSLYRRGVFVRELLKQKPPLFCYNFQDGKIDECRNMSDSEMMSAAAKLLEASQSALERVFDSFRGEEKWEHTLGYFINQYGTKAKQTICEAWKAVFGSQPLADNVELSSALTKRNIAHCLVPSYWAETLVGAGIIHGRTLLRGIDLRGDDLPATERAIATFRMVWAWLESAHLTSGKQFPKVGCFTKPMQVGSETIGYYHDGTVYLNIDYDGNDQTALEELAHYITGAKDESRDLQDFAFKAAARLAKIK